MAITFDEFQRRYRYDELNDLIGEGGVGKVFRAYDTTLSRWVAVKTAPVPKEESLERLRLRNEAEMASKLPPHPNIARYEECHTFRVPTLGEADYAIMQYPSRPSCSAPNAAEMCPPAAGSALTAPPKNGRGPSPYPYHRPNPLDPHHGRYRHRSSFTLRPLPSCVGRPKTKVPTKMTTKALL